MRRVGASCCAAHPASPSARHPGDRRRRQAGHQGGRPQRPPAVPLASGPARCSMIGGRLLRADGLLPYSRPAGAASRGAIAGLSRGYHGANAGRVHELHALYTLCLNSRCDTMRPLASLLMCRLSNALADYSPPEITTCGRRPDATVDASTSSETRCALLPSLPAMSVLGGVLLAYLAFFLLTCRAPYSGDEWGPQWLSCARTVRSASRHATHIATLRATNTALRATMCVAMCAAPRCGQILALTLWPMSARRGPQWLSSAGQKRRLRAAPRHAHRHTAEARVGACCRTRATAASAAAHTATPRTPRQPASRLPRAPRTVATVARATVTATQVRPRGGDARDAQALRPVEQGGLRRPRRPAQRAAAALRLLLAARRLPGDDPHPPPNPSLTLTLPSP